MAEIHLLIQDSLRQWTLACGTRHATEATWNRAMVTCRNCLKKGQPRISEKVFQAKVIALAQSLGWLVYHTHDSRKSVPGFPDLVCARAGYPVLFAELKSSHGAMTPHQKAWHATLMAALPSCQVFLWRPDDWDTIGQVLTGTISRPAIGCPQCR